MRHKPAVKSYAAPECSDLALSSGAWWILYYGPNLLSLSFKYVVLKCEPQKFDRFVTKRTFGWSNSEISPSEGQQYVSKCCQMGGPTVTLNDYDIEEVIDIRKSGKRPSHYVRERGGRVDQPERHCGKYEMALGCGERTSLLSLIRQGQLLICFG